MDISPVASTQINKKSNKRKFSDEQVRSMESMFNSESRPGLKTKQQIADQLGLDHRQVAIWFQNRRARTKSKQKECVYGILKAQYESLASKYEALAKENQSLINEVQRLRALNERCKNTTSDMTPATCRSNGESICLSSINKHIAPQEDYVQDKILSEAKTKEILNYEERIDDFNVIEIDDTILSSSKNYSNLEPTYLNCASYWVNMNEPFPYSTANADSMFSSFEPI